MQRIGRRRLRRSRRTSRRSESNFRVVRADLVLHKMHDTRSRLPFVHEFGAKLIAAKQNSKFRSSLLQPWPTARAEWLFTALSMRCCKRNHRKAQSAAAAGGKHEERQYSKSVYRPIRPSPLPKLAGGANTVQWWIVCGNLQVRTSRSASILMSPFWPILAQTFEFCPRGSSRC